MRHHPYKALYIHIPFCGSRCDYCDFHTQAIDRSSPLIQEYVDYLMLELKRLSNKGELEKIETVYIGGGTPSFIGNRCLTQILYLLGCVLALDGRVEFSMEANPDSIDERLIKDIWALGVNRLSIGVQSFNDEELKACGRIHNAKEALAAIDCAASRFENISIDLMCGLPGQSIESFSQSLDTALSMPIKHISVYPLALEIGTPLAKKVRRRKVVLPDDDLVADMMELAEKKLTDKGMRRYEVASYALPGFECRHNIAYWSGKPYLGVGHSAATMTQDDNRRMRVQDGIVTDDLDAAQMKAEDIMLAMRMSRGISIADIEDSKDTLPDIEEVFAELVGDGLVEVRSSRYVPTKKGWLLGNELYGRIFDLA